MRLEEISLGEHYHIYNRSHDKQEIFLDSRDYARFLFLILYFQSPVEFFNLSRPVSQYVRRSAFNIDQQKVAEVLKTRTVELVSFAIMPNHFHLLVCEKRENGISKYMHRVQTAYAKYFNTKYKKVGHLWSGAYKVVSVDSNEQLLHLSAYIHRNPRGLKEWKNKEENYSWSSYQDYTKGNRWGLLIEQDIILEQFNSVAEYDDFLRTSSAKKVDEMHQFDER